MQESVHKERLFWHCDDLEVYILALLADSFLYTWPEMLSLFMAVEIKNKNVRQREIRKP